MIIIFNHNETPTGMAYINYLRLADHVFQILENKQSMICIKSRDGHYKLNKKYQICTHKEMKISEVIESK